MHQKNKKKILYVITKGNWGGAQHYVYDLATSISEENFEVRVAFGIDGTLKNKLNENNISTIKIPHLGRDINMWDDLYSFFEMFHLFRYERPDVIHLNSPKTGFLGALAGRMAGIKNIIYTSHGWPFNENRNILIRLIFFILSWVTVILSKKTITVSEIDRKRVDYFPFIKNKLVTIHNGIKEVKFLEKNLAKNMLIRKRVIESNPNTIWLGMIGELHKNKGYEYIIEALPFLAKNSSNFILFIIGSGEERESLIRDIKEHGLEKKVILLGFLENASSYLKAFDIFIMSSVKEGFPYVLLEAGLAQIPVIATNVGGISEIISNEKNGLLVKDKKPKELAHAIEKLCKDKKMSLKYSESMYNKINSQFTLEKMVSKTKVLY